MRVLGEEYNNKSKKDYEEPFDIKLQKAIAAIAAKALKIPLRTISVKHVGRTTFPNIPNTNANDKNEKGLADTETIAALLSFAQEAIKEKNFPLLQVVMGPSILKEHGKIYKKLYAAKKDLENLRSEQEHLVYYERLRYITATYNLMLTCSSFFSDKEESRKYWSDRALETNFLDSNFQSKPQYLAAKLVFNNKIYPTYLGNPSDLNNREYKGLACGDFQATINNLFAYSIRNHKTVFDFIANLESCSHQTLLNTLKSFECQDEKSEKIRQQLVNIDEESYEDLHTKTLRDYLDDVCCNVFENINRGYQLRYEQQEILMLMLKKLADRVPGKALEPAFLHPCEKLPLTFTSLSDTEKNKVLEELRQVIVSADKKTSKHTDDIIGHLENKITELFFKVKKVKDVIQRCEGEYNHCEQKFLTFAKGLIDNQLDPQLFTRLKQKLLPQPLYSDSSSSSSSSSSSYQNSYQNGDESTQLVHRILESRIGWFNLNELAAKINIKENLLEAALTKVNKNLSADEQGAFFPIVEFLEGRRDRFAYLSREAVVSTKGCLRIQLLLLKNQIMKTKAGDEERLQVIEMMKSGPATLVLAGASSLSSQCRELQQEKQQDYVLLVLKECSGLSRDQFLLEVRRNEEEHSSVNRRVHNLFFRSLKKIIGNDDYQQIELSVENKRLLEVGGHVQLIERGGKKPDEKTYLLSSGIN